MPNEDPGEGRIVLEVIREVTLLYLLSWNICSRRSIYELGDEVVRVLDDAGG